jgi:hypothetical protein
MVSPASSIIKVERKIDQINAPDPFILGDNCQFKTTELYQKL